MRFIIITSSPLVAENGNYSAYGPYIKEMNLWAKYVDEVAFCCPVRTNEKKLLRDPVAFKIARIYKVKETNFKTPLNALKAIFWLIYNFFVVVNAMIWAEHIHLRCPGNIGLLGCVAQLFFPHKTKTIKYAGNWDFKAKQPVSYRIQKYILNNTLLCRNAKVLVYGNWQNRSRNIVPFFTASYYENEKTPVQPKTLSGKLKFIYVGTLNPGKNCNYAIDVTSKLRKKGYDVELRLYGEGVERETILNYINKIEASEYVFLEGNKDSNSLKQIYQNAHCLLLASKSEGWPKVVAESMFWGCLPVASPVSCVPDMLDYGKRGVLLQMKPDIDVAVLEDILTNQLRYNQMCEAAENWSRNYTIDSFESEIQKMISK